MTPNPVNSARGDTLSRERSSEVSTEVHSLDAATEPQERVDLDAIRARWEAATPGPWEVATGFSSDPPLMVDGWPLKVLVDADEMDDDVARRWFADAVAIAHAPTDIAALLAEVERLRVETQTPEERLLREIFTKPAAPARTFAAALDEWRRSASPEVPSDLDTALRAWEVAEGEVGRARDARREGGA